jgi:hypothetical protein
MIIPLPQSSSTQPTPQQAQFSGGASRVSQSTISMAGVSAPQAVQVDSRIAGFDAAPLQAFGELGMRVADGLHNIQMERYEAQNKVHLADAQLEMAQTFAQFENWKLESNADPSTWDEAWKERADTIQAKFDSEQKFSPAARQALGLELKSWRGNTGIRVSTDAAKAVFQKAADHDIANIRSAIARGDVGAVQSIAGPSKYISAPDKVNYFLQAQDMRKQLDEKAALDADISRISENPRAWLTENADMKPQGYDDLKRMNYLKGQAQSMLQDQTQGATEEILNGFAMAGEKGRVMQDEEIERMANGRLSPYALERLKEENASRYNAQEKARRASPDYQKELFGRTSAMIEQFDPLADGADDTLVELNMQIGQMSEGNSTELRARLNKKRDQANGKPVENTLQDAARKQLQEIMLKPSRFETQVKPSTAVLSGLLLDKGKMQQAGLSEAQASAIAGVYKDKDKGGYRKAMERFREEINTIDRSKVQKGALGSYDQAAIDALMNGTDEMQTITDQEAKFSAHAEYGEAEKNLNDWFSKNPNADTDQVKEAMRKIMGDSKAVIELKAPPFKLGTPPVKVDPEAHKKVSMIPYNGVPANVRYNNPAAAWPRPADAKYGLIGYGVLNDGEGNKIGRFPSPVHGAAANFDLFASKYTGMSLRSAMTKWRGRPSPVPKGYDPAAVVDEGFLNDPDRAVDFFKKMALHESPDFKSMTDDDWRSAWQMWRNGGA